MTRVRIVVTPGTVIICVPVVVAKYRADWDPIRTVPWVYSTVGSPRVPAPLVSSRLLSVRLRYIGDTRRGRLECLAHTAKLLLRLGDALAMLLKVVVVE